ncbi:MAG: hypothetical protein ACFFFB_11810 [Candidatus Heimdallarchaeota archaeon]
MKKLFGIIFITIICIADISWIFYDLFIRKSDPWYAILFIVVFGVILIGYHYLGSPFRENRPLYYNTYRKPALIGETNFEQLLF